MDDMDRGAKICSWHQGHITKMAAMPIYIVKTLKRSSRNHWTDFHETWYMNVASGTRVYHGYVSPEGLGDVLFFPGRLSVRPSVRLSVTNRVRSVT